MTTTAAEPRASAREVPPVAAFVARRLVGAVIALLIASVLIFLGTSVLPGDAASVVLGRGATPTAVARLNTTGHASADLAGYAAESIRRAERLDDISEQVRDTLRGHRRRP